MVSGGTSGDGATPADRVRAAQHQAATLATWQLVRWWVTTAVAVGVLVLVPVFQVRSFLLDEHLRARGPELSARVTFVQVHGGKGAWVEVDVDTDPGGPARDVEVSADFDLDHPPELGQRLQVVVDPDDPDHVVLADSPDTLPGTLAEAVLFGLMLSGAATLLGMGAAFPSRPTLQAVRARSAVAAAATVVRAAAGTPPQGRVYRELRNGKFSEFVEVDLELRASGGAGPADGPPHQLTAWFLVGHNGADLHAGLRVVVVGSPELGGRCAVVAARPCFAATPLVPTPDRPPLVPRLRSGASLTRPEPVQYRARRRVYIDADGRERKP